MKQFFAFARKEFYHIFRDRRTMMIVLVMPVIQTFLFGFAINMEVKDVRVTVFDLSKDVATRRLTEKIDASKYFNVERYINSFAEVDDLFRKNRTDLVIVYQERFNDNLLHTGKASVQLIVDGTDPNNAAQLSGYINSIIGDYQLEVNGGELSIPMQITPEIKLLYNPQMKSAYNFVPGVMGLVLMLICAMMTSISIVREKERGTMEVLLVSPMKPFSIIIAKTIPYLFLSAVSLALILVMSVYVLDVPIVGSLFWLCFICLLFIMVSLSLGILISSLVSTQVAAMLVSGMGMMMPVMLLSGMIFPVEGMPEILQWISVVIPARWFIEAVKKIMIQGLDISYALKEIGILIFMTLVLIAASLKIFKFRLE